MALCQRVLAVHQLQKPVHCVTVVSQMTSASTIKAIWLLLQLVENGEDLQGATDIIRRQRL